MVHTLLQWQQRYRGRVSLSGGCDGKLTCLKANTQTYSHSIAAVLLPQTSTVVACRQNKEKLAATHLLQVGAKVSNSTLTRERHEKVKRLCALTAGLVCKISHVLFVQVNCTIQGT